MTARRFAPADGVVDVVAVIVTLGKDLPRLSACLDAVRAQDADGSLGAVLVLNAAEIDEAGIVALAGDDITLVRPGFNLGWAGGVVAGRAAAPHARRLWLVQDDMIAAPGCLRAETAALDADARLALVSPVSVTPAGLVAAWSCGGTLRREPRIELDRWFPAEDTAVDALPDADLDYVASRGMLVDLDAWDAVGGMHPGYYPVIWTDVDLCAAVRAAGREFALVGDAQVRHEGHGSTPSPYGTFLLERHRGLFAARWGSPAGPAAPPTPTTVSPALVESIARAAAALAADLGREYSGQSERLSSVENALALARAETDSARREIADLRASTSWRVTAPLRALARSIARR